MAFGKKFDKSKLKEKRKQQNPLFKRKKFCRFTVANVEQVDYKDVDTLKDFVQENGKIMPARLTGTLHITSVRWIPRSSARVTSRCCRTPICITPDRPILIESWRKKCKSF